MPQTRSRLFDDFSKLMTDAAGLAEGARREVDTALRSQLERLLAGMDVVKRDEFEAVREMDLNHTRIYQASSSEMFGASAPPQSEATPFLCVNGGTALCKFVYLLRLPLLLHFARYSSGVRL